MNHFPPTPQVSTVVADPTSVDAAIGSRFSARAFLDKPVDRAVLMEVLTLAGRAPSGTNTQPWKVYVLQGAQRDELERQVCAAHDALAANPALAAQYAEAYDYYPEKWFSPYIDRRRECGFGLYSVLGIGKGDKLRMHEQHQRNFKLFDAPVGLMFTIDKGLGRGSLLDYGMFLQTLMIAARSRGLHTCPQAAWNHFAQIILPLVGAGENEMLVCGMSLGYADEAAPANRFQTTRVDAAEFTHFVE
ncbi:MAG: nitroreductase [Betaproteobacteria bacterium]|nr:nitroreductase [Betaproteobacteria bacterium]